MNLHRPLPKLIVAVLGLLLLFGNARAQHAEAMPLKFGLVEQLQSAALGESRTLNIYLPDGYDSQAEITYPVLYLLDGSTNEDLLHICGLVQFLVMIEVMPPTIVVGIANVDRRRDFTFPTTIEKDKKDYPTTGGSEKFIAFLENELQPYIVANYKTNGLKIIIGQSLGGLLASEILLKKPHLFDQYIIVSPSLWWDKQSLLRAAPQHLAQHGKDPKHVVIMVGNETKEMENDAADLAAVLKEKGSAKLKVDYVFLPDESHLTILHRAAYQGLELLHKGKK